MSSNQLAIIIFSIIIGMIFGFSAARRADSKTADMPEERDFDV